MNPITDVHELSERHQLLGHARIYDKERLFDEFKECSVDVLHWGDIPQTTQNDMLTSLDEGVIYGFMK